MSEELFLKLREKTNKLKNYGYKFNSCISEKKIRAFEKKYKVNLPEDYRNYLKIIGNGGDGPKEEPHIIGWKDYSDFNYIYPIQKSETLGQCYYSIYDKRTSFRKMGRPFLYSENRQENEKALDILSPIKKLNSKTQNLYQGCLILSHQGCGACLVMEVTGKKKGRIWFEEFSRDNKVTLVSETFYEWYYNWVIETLQYEEINHEIYNIDFTITNPRSYIYLGYNYAKKALLDLAEECFNKSMEMSPDDIVLYDYWAYSYKINNKIDEALKIYKRAIKIKPDLTEAYIMLGDFYKELELIDEAIEQYDKALEIDSLYYRPYKDLARYYKDKKQYDKSIEFYNKTISIIPQNYELYFALANVYSEIEDYEKCIKYQLKALEICPNNQLILLSLGIDYFINDMFEEAKEKFETILNLNPQQTDAYYYLGTTYKKLGKYDKAISIYKNIIDSKPDYSMAYYRLSFIYEIQGNIEESEKLYQKAVLLNPELKDSD